MYYWTQRIRRGVKDSAVRCDSEKIAAATASDVVNSDMTLDRIDILFGPDAEHLEFKSTVSRLSQEMSKLNIGPVKTQS
jgi:hypothetical protein